MNEVRYIPASTEACLRTLYLSQAIRELCEIKLPAQLQSRDLIVGQLVQAIANEINPVMELTTNE